MPFTIRVRGAGGPMLAEYRCPMHGVFEALVTRDTNGDPPSVMPCPDLIETHHVCGDHCAHPPFGPFDEVHEYHGCEIASPWTISCPAVHTQFLVSASRGRNDAKPHAKSMDTRMLAEGRKNDFRKQRKAIREQERHEKVKRLLS